MKINRKKEVKKAIPAPQSSDRMIIQSIKSISKPESMDFDQGASNIFNGEDEYSLNSVSVSSNKDDLSNVCPNIFFFGIYYASSY